MKNRERILLFAVLGLLVLWQAPGIYRSLFVEPVESRETALGSLKDTVEIKEHAKGNLLATQRRMGRLKQRSLPPDPVKAATVYYNWLVDQTAQSKLTLRKDDGILIQRNTPALEKDTYYLITATVNAQATLDKLCDFLHAFHESGLLHRVTQIRFENKNGRGDDPVLDATLVIEALALKDSPARDTLRVDAERPEPPEKHLDPRAEYASITSRKLFAPGYNGPPRPPDVTPPRQVAKVDEAEYVRLIGTVARGEQLDAWLFDQLENRRLTLTRGERFRVAGIAGRTIDIELGHVVLEIDGERFRLNLGESLRQMTREG